MELGIQLWESVSNTLQKYGALFKKLIRGEIKMSEYLLYEEEKKVLGVNPLNITNKDVKLINLCCAVKAGYKDLIKIFVKNALDEGFSREDLLKAVSMLIEEGPALDSIIEFLRALSYEENIRREPISIVDDCRED